jgi:hypothetical protein
MFHFKSDCRLVLIESMAGFELWKHGIIMDHLCILMLEDDILKIACHTFCVKCLGKHSAICLGVCRGHLLGGSEQWQPE